MIKKQLSDDRIHSGHRARMKAKLTAHGSRIFDTYELLEMLLYFTTQYKDTNPVAKRLLYAFSSLDGVMNAGREELLEVEGVGGRAADIILAVAEVEKSLGTEITGGRENIFSDYAYTANFLISKLGACDGKKVVAMYLDNSMRLISCEEIAGGLDYDSAGIKPKAFIDGALKNRAAVIITAHNHPFGSPYPTPGDRETNYLITSALNAVGVLHAEHYVISGNRFSGLSCKLGKHLFQSAELARFEEGKAANMKADLPWQSGDNDIAVGLGVEVFFRLLSFASAADAENLARKLVDKYTTVENCLNADIAALAELVGEKAALLVKLSAYLISRRGTDSFTFMKRHTEAELADFCKALYVGASVETVYLICFDKSWRTVACEFVNEGTVNSSEIMTRRILELAVKHSAYAVAMVHNHPFGVATPSAEDIGTSAELGKVLRSVGIELAAHFVVAGQKCELVR